MFARGVVSNDQQDPPVVVLPIRCANANNMLSENLKNHAAGLELFETQQIVRSPNRAVSVAVSVWYFCG